MRRSKRVLVAAVAVLAVAGAAAYVAADRWGRPKQRLHGLLVFGPGAKVRVPVAVEGGAIYLDRNGDGTFSGADERFAVAGPTGGVVFPDPDGVTTYALTYLSARDEKLPDGTPARALMPRVEVRGPVAYKQYGDLLLSPDPAAAPVAHFHGPLEARPREVLGKLPPGFKLKTGDKPTDLNMMVGTFDQARGCWVVVDVHEADTCRFPDGVRPTAAVEFPPKAPGEPPVRKVYTLSGFC